MIDRIQSQFEKYAFGVCSWCGGKLGVNPSRIRIYFIYAGCATLGSMVIPYLVMAFFLRLRRERRTRVWDF